MNSLKAIISGVVFVIVAILLMQLAYLFIAVGYNNLSKTMPALKEISWIFRYLVAIPVVLAIMFSGGYLTALIAKRKVILHALIVAIITIGGTMWMALENAEITTAGIIINLLMISATAVGAFFQQRSLKEI